MRVKDPSADGCGELVGLAGFLIVFIKSLMDARFVIFNIGGSEYGDEDDEFVACKPYYEAFGTDGFNESFRKSYESLVAFLV